MSILIIFASAIYSIYFGYFAEVKTTTRMHLVHKNSSSTRLLEHGIWQPGAKVREKGDQDQRHQHNKKKRCYSSQYMG